MTDCDYSGRSYEIYFRTVFDEYLDLGLTIGAIKAKLITLQYPSLEQLDLEVQLMIATARSLYTGDPVAEEHFQAVVEILENYKATDQWVSYDSEHLLVTNNPPTGN